jgi:poly-gamma-glutamate capsule biosynthesis protein CapA/YwtB (metallophosphatase superfamily)
MVLSCLMSVALAEPVTVVAVGDVLMHSAVKRTAREANVLDPDGTSANHEGMDVVFEGVKTVIGAADLSIANLETPVAPDTRLPLHGHIFNGPGSLPGALAHVGFDVVSLANNHVWDQGGAGLTETLRRLEAAGLVAVGAGSDCGAANVAKIEERGGIRFAMLSRTDLLNLTPPTGEGAPCAAATGPACAADCGPDRDAISHDVDEAAMIAAIRAARAKADVVLLSLHWGHEYHTAPGAEQRALAQRLTDSGVDVLIGHHSHVLQPVEVRTTVDGRRAVVAYSLGNFVSDMAKTWGPKTHTVRRANMRDGIILSLSFEREDGRLVQRDPVAIPTWTRNNAVTRGEGDPTQIGVVTHKVARAAPLEGEAALLDMRHAAMAAIVGPWLVDGPVAALPTP